MTMPQELDLQYSNLEHTNYLIMSQKVDDTEHLSNNYRDQLVDPHTYINARETMSIYFMTSEE